MVYYITDYRAWCMLDTIISDEATLAEVLEDAESKRKEKAEGQEGEQNPSTGKESARSTPEPHRNLRIAE